MTMVPKNIKDTFGNWKTEILGSVHIHSKVIVLPISSGEPVVMTGSHNRLQASRANDDNR